MFHLHTVQMPDGAGPQIPDRLTLASVLALPYPAAANALGSVGAVTAGNNYTAIPAIAATGGTLAAGGWPAVLRATLKVITPALQNAGAGYAINDTLTFANGVVITVNTVSSGAIATFTLTNAGSFAGNGVLPGTGGVPVGNQSQIATSGSGSGATFSFTWGLNTVVVDDSGNYSVIPTGFSVTNATGDTTGSGGAVAAGAATAAGAAVFRAIGPFVNDGVPPNYGVAAISNQSPQNDVAELNVKVVGYASIKIQPAVAANSVVAGTLDALIWA